MPPAKIEHIEGTEQQKSRAFSPAGYFVTITT